LSGAMAFIPWIGRVTGLGDEHSFYLVRVLLGAAEAGFFPGIIFYLTLWFPAVYRARIVGYFMAAIPLSSVIGSPISGWILYMHGGFGLAGWQWLFIIEAVPAIILAVVVFFYLTDRPAGAAWLEPGERQWLQARLDAEQQARVEAQHISVGQALIEPRVLALSIVYFGAVAANYGTAYWLPQIVKTFGVTNWQNGLISAVPYIVGTIGMVWYGRRSDRHMERKGHAAVALAIAALGIGASALVDDPLLKMVALTIGAFGVFAVLPVFWTFPTAFLSGAAAAAGIAVINSIGNLAGFFGPFVMGWLREATGNFAAGLLVIAAFALLAMVVVLLLRHQSALERAPEGENNVAGQPAEHRA